MYNRKQVLVLDKILIDSNVVGLRYRFCDGDIIYEIGKENFRTLFKGYIVLNAKLASDLLVQHIEGTPKISILNRSGAKDSSSCLEI